MQLKLPHCPSCARNIQTEPMMPGRRYAGREPTTGPTAGRPTRIAYLSVNTAHLTCPAPLTDGIPTPAPVAGRPFQTPKAARHQPVRHATRRTSLGP